MPENPKINKQYNIGKIGTAHFHHYGDKKIKHLLTEPPFIPELFLGRDADLQEIHNRLFAPKGHLLLLVNGEGGIGKSSLASQYLHTYHEEYAHVAWVFSERSIANALLQLAIPLDLQFDERADTLQRLQILIQAMFELNKPCLLVIDNANELEDLCEHLPHLQRCSNFHILFTTRINDFPQLASYKIEPLTQDQALQAFKAHYPAFEPQEEALFYEIYTAVQGNTLVLELLAKNLHNFNNKLKKHYLLADLHRDLEHGLLQLSKTSVVDIRYQAQGTGLRHEKIEVIIAAMYDLGDLSAVEVQVLSIFAVLPAESIPFERLEALKLGLEGLDTTLLTLAQKGWLEYNEAAASFKCSPVVQEVVRLKNENLLEDCRGLIDGVTDKLKYEGLIGHLLNITYLEAVEWARWATALVGVPWEADHSIALLCERLGSYHKTSGNLAQALTFFEEYYRLKKELYATNPENVEFKNGLASAYGTLGVIQISLGNLSQALTYFEQYNSLEKELYAAYPENVEFKNSLAISYEKLGETQTSLSNLPRALTYFEQYNSLERELYDAYPENVEFKNSLAISYEKLGITNRDLGNLSQAMTYFEKDIELSKELYAINPENVSFKNGLAIAYEKLGSMQTLLGNLSKALTHFEKSNQVINELHEAFPQNVFFKDELAISCQFLGNTHRDLGNLQQALTFFEQYSQLAKELHTAYPDNVEFKNSLAISFIQLGYFHEQKMQDSKKAGEHYQASKVLLEELVASFPDYVQFKQNLNWLKKHLSANHSFFKRLSRLLSRIKNIGRM